MVTYGLNADFGQVFSCSGACFLTFVRCARSAKLDVPKASAHGGSVRYRLAIASALVLICLHCASEDAHVAPLHDASVDGALVGDGARTFVDAGDGGARSDAASDVFSDGVGFTSDFRAYLAANGMSALLRSDLGGPPGYGGRTRAGEGIAKEPVVFVHGNSDRAVGGSLGGWNASIEALLAAGYGSREIYALTWGPADSAQAANQYHSRAHLTLVRSFLEAVLGYTGAAKVDIVAHSMGVTLARKAILGGAANDALGGGAYDLGLPLTARVDTFLGIAGANLGLSSCYFTGPSTPTCGATNGFYPGVLSGGNVVGMSQFLSDLNVSAHFEGSHVFSLWSSKDEILGPGTLVYGKPTATLPGEDGVVRKDALGHMDCKNTTAATQLALVTKHAE